MKRFECRVNSDRYEHYGNMVAYMRIRGIVPSTSEKGAGAGPD